MCHTCTCVVTKEYLMFDNIHDLLLTYISACSTSMIFFLLFCIVTSNLTEMYICMYYSMCGVKTSHLVYVLGYMHDSCMRVIKKLMMEIVY